MAIDNIEKNKPFGIKKKCIWMRMLKLKTPKQVKRPKNVPPGSSIYRLFYLSKATGKAEVFKI